MNTNNVELLNCRLMCVEIRGLSALVGLEFPPMLGDCVGETELILLNKPIKL